MRNPRVLVCLFVAGLLSSGSVAAVTPSAQSEGQGALVGRVSGETTPLRAVWVYAYELADLTLHKVRTDGEGRFIFRSLPAGLYKVIAHKRGFVPAVVVLTRSAANAYQFLEFRLAAEPMGEIPEGGDFWSVRGRIPGDVLREIQIAEARALPREDFSGARFQTEMQAFAGIDQVGDAAGARLTVGRLGVLGQVGSLELDLSGDFRWLEPTSYEGSGTPTAEGQTSALSFSVRNEQQTRVTFSTLRNNLLSGADVAMPVDLEQYRLSWSQPVGDRAQSSFAAQYIHENNFYRNSALQPLAGVPAASRTWRLEGSYEARVGDRTSFQTGVSYRQRVGDLAPVASAHPGEILPQERIDLFGLGDWRAQPAVLLQYGLYTTLRDGSVSLTPKGGLVLDLGTLWEAEASVSQRLSDEGSRGTPDFLPVYYGEKDSCGAAEEHCYTVRLTRKGGENRALSVGAVHRKFADTLRLYFSQDFFNQLESLYLVQGDELPEFQFTISQRLSPRVLATWESNVASGGGGIFRAGDESSYENEVRYLVTSLDTEFQRTSTGLFLAFHRVEQQLNPVTGQSIPGPQQLEIDRLQIMLTQDLDILLDLGSHWAALLNMELSRGSTLEALADSEIHKRVLGGLAFRF